MTSMSERDESLIRRRNFLSTAVTLLPRFPLRWTRTSPSLLRRNPATSARSEGTKLEAQTTERRGCRLHDRRLHTPRV